MSSVRDKTDKLVEYIDEAKKMGIAVLPPDVNASLVDFAVVGEEIRFGLAAVKGVGENAVRAILDGADGGRALRGPVRSRQARRLKAVNRKVYEALIKCGALDPLPGQPRATARRARCGARGRVARGARPRDGAGVAVRDDRGAASVARSRRCGRCRRRRRWSSSRWEKETLGIFVSGHPLADVTEALARTGAVPVRELRALEDDSQVKVAGLVTAVRRTLTKAQSQMLIATIEDTTGAVECVVFPEAVRRPAGAVHRGRDRRRHRPAAPARTPRRRRPARKLPLELNVSVNDVQPFDRNCVRAAAPPPTAGTSP